MAAPISPRPAQDEKGTVALKAVELDEALGGGPVQFREVQGHESDEFFGAFKALGGVTYKEGGVASGFNHVEPDVYPTVLLHIKGKRNVRTKQVAVAASSLNQGDVFILDKGLTLFLWWGTEANKQERLKGMQVLARLYNSRGARPLQIIVNEEPDNEEFWSTLGGTAADVASAEAGGADDDRAAASELKLFKVSDASGTLETTEVPMEGGKLLRSALDTNDSFIVDAGSQIYVWTGRGATAQEKKGGLAIAKAFLKEQGRPDWCPVQRVVEGGETPVFKSLFKEWDPLPSFNFAAHTSSGRACADTVEAKEIDFSAIAKASSEADQVAVDDGSGELTVWILEGTTKSEYPREQYGQFFAGDSYLVQYAYTGPSGPANMIYFWLGSESDKVERGSAAVNAIELSKSIAGPSTQVRVVQGHEPWHFSRLFEGGMIIHAGGRQGAREVEGNRLYHVRGTNAENTKAVEVPCSAANLNSGDCFVIATPDFTLLWQGKHANDAEKATALNTATKIGGELYTIDEGEEDDTFWEHLGGKEEYPEAVPAPGAPEPKLLHVNDHAGYLAVETIFAFTQEDLADDDVFILDTFTQVFVWVGSTASTKEKEGAMDIAQKYLAACTDGRDEDTPIIRIAAGSEPPIFTCNFQGWKEASAGFVDPYEARLAQLRAEREAAEAAQEAKDAAAGAVAAESTPAAPAPAPAAAVPAGESIPYADLVAATPDGPLSLDWANKEKYLSDDEFASVLGMSKAEFAALPAWKRKDKKKAVNLF